MSATPERHFTPQELAGFDGSDGKPTYVAHKGMVYDVSGSKLWKAGKHMNRHHAGGDMGLELSTAPHSPAVLERFPKVGVLDCPGRDPGTGHPPGAGVARQVHETVPHAQAPPASHDRAFSPSPLAWPRRSAWCSGWCGAGRASTRPCCFCWPRPRFLPRWPS